MKAKPQKEQIISDTLNVKELFEALRQVAKQNLLTVAEIKHIIETSVFKSFHTKYDPDAELELIFDEPTNRFELINKSKMVVADNEFDASMRAIEIGLTDAKKIDAKATVGGVIAEVVDFKAYSKPIAQQIRQMITQSVRERKKEAVWEKHQSLKGQMIDVTVTVVTPNYVICQLDDGTSAFMPAKLRNANIALKIGERTKVYVEDVLKEAKDSQIVVSNGSSIVVRGVLELEVPEIADGTISIVNISRMAGERSKVAVKANREGVDAVGAIIGAHGSRINAIIAKLQGEKLDVIQWSPDVNTFVANALAPSRIIMVFDKVDENGQPIENYKVAIAPDRHQTLAIGRGGSNARLAVELVNSRIDIISYSEAVERGISVVWNGNITPAEVEMLEAGAKLSSRPPRAGAVARPYNATSPSATAHVSTSMFDDAINSFNEEIEVAEKHATSSFEIDDEIFSDEELRAMEANFEFDDEITEAEDGNDNKGEF